MTASQFRHSWVVTGPAAPHTGSTLTLPEPHLEVTCHRRLRGPYTGAGALLERVVPELLEHHADLVLPRTTSIVAVAPELAQHLPLPEKTLTEAAGPKERTRFYATGRTARLAHAVVELLIDWARALHPDGAVVAFSDVAEADPTDHELLRALLRRCDPRLVNLLVELDGPADQLLETALRDHATRVPRPPRAQPEPPTDSDLAQWYIDSDGTCIHPGARAAYDALAEDERARRHTARAEELMARGEPGLRLGAIPYHMERGSDRTGAGADIFLEATTTCLEKGYYHASMDLALRGRKLVGPQERPDVYWNLTTKVAACLSYLGPSEEAIRYLNELRHTVDAEMHMRAAYMTAMIYTRYLPKDTQDHDRALEWSNTSIVIADNYPKPERRAFNGAFMRNGRALVELHRGNIQGALDLVNEAIAMTDSHLGADQQLLHRSVLVHNRAQVHAAIGDYERALDDYDEVIRRDPNYGEYYFDRAAVRRAAGRYAEAMEDYAAAIRLNPPFHEAHYNRADLLRELGDDEAALKDLDYALELEPDHVDSIVNRVDLLLDHGDVTRAARDIEHGLQLEPQNARLLCARGSVLAEIGDDPAAWESYSAALAADPTLAAAWANRAVLAYLTDQPGQAVDDLTQAIQLADDEQLRLNRAIALQSLGQHQEAIEDLNAALLAGVNDPDVLYHRGTSKRAVGDPDGALADWKAHLAAYDGAVSPFLDQIRLAEPQLLAGATQPEAVS